MITEIVKTCSSLIDSFLTRCAVGIAFAVVSFSFKDLSQDAMVALSFLIIFDFITAIIATRKTKEKVQSRKIFRTAAKFVIYFMLIVAAHFAEIGLGFEFVLDEIVIGYLAATEFLSVLENVEKMGYSVPSKLKSLLKAYRKRK